VAGADLKVEPVADIGGHKTGGQPAANMVAVHNHGAGNMLDLDIDGGFAHHRNSSSS
jgi:hypothetical protein